MKKCDDRYCFISLKLSIIGVNNFFCKKSDFLCIFLLTDETDVVYHACIIVVLRAKSNVYL
jgi:hypothetical protein